MAIKKNNNRNTTATTDEVAFCVSAIIAYSEKFNKKTNEVSELFLKNGVYSYLRNNFQVEQTLSEETIIENINKLIDKNARVR